MALYRLHFNGSGHWTLDTKVRRGERREDGLGSGCPVTGVLWGELAQFSNFQSSFRCLSMSSRTFSNSSVICFPVYRNVLIPSSLSEAFIFLSFSSS